MVPISHFLFLCLLIVSAHSYGFQPQKVVGVPVFHLQQFRLFSFSSHQYAGFHVKNRRMKLYATAASSEINVIPHSSSAESLPKFTLNLANQLTISRICAIPLFMIALVMRKVHHLSISISVK
jgi:hypothetical protein